jgi:uncharacterized membrane protein YkoI
MKTFKKYFLSLFIVTLFFACGEDDDPINISAEQAAAKALEIVSGQVTSTELDDSGTVPEWDVNVTTDAGSKIELEFDQATGELLEIEGNEGPFTYEVDPGLGLVVFSQAKETAFNEAEIGELSNWELEQDETGKWIYEFIIVNDGQEHQIKIDAVTGSVID